MAKSYKHFDDKEKAMLKKWLREGKSCSEVAKLLARDLSSVCRQAAQLKSKKAVNKVGCPSKLNHQQIGVLLQKAKTLIAAADGKFQVTADMLKAAAGLKCCTRVVLNALHANGIYMHPLREKPVRTEADEKDGLAFARHFSEKPTAVWKQDVHAYLDNKTFPVYLNKKSRAYAAKLRGARGTFQFTAQANKIVEVDRNAHKYPVLP